MTDTRTPRTAVITVDHRQVPAGIPSRPHDSRRRVLRAMVALDVVLAVWYFSWLLRPSHAGTWWLYGLLIAAELFNLVQASGFWWTLSHDRPPLEVAPWPGPDARVDVLIPTYNEPLDVVEPTVAAAIRMQHAEITVFLLDDGDRPEMRRLAARYGVRYITRPDHRGAKAGNINHALALSDAPFVAIFDCDHVPTSRFLGATLGHFTDPDVAFVQTPQYYSNRDAGPIAAAAATQQDLFFGVIARGKNSMGAMFCCGTNFVFRRRALAEVGGFPTDSLTEDFELSMRLHKQGWQSRYVSTILAHGLGPEDMTSYVSQQARWAQGCLSALPRILFSRLPFRLRLQYLLASMYFLSGLTTVVYMSLPFMRIVFGVQPLDLASANQFLAHFVPYFVACVITVAVASEGRYTFSAYSLAAANFGVHVRAAGRVLLRRRSTFVVTPKHGVDGRQLRPVRPALIAIGLLVAAIIWALATSRATSTITNVCFASIHVVILSSGVWGALMVRRAPDEVVIDVTDAIGPEAVEGSDLVLEPVRVEADLAAMSRQAVRRS